MVGFWLWLLPMAVGCLTELPPHDEAMDRNVESLLDEERTALHDKRPLLAKSFFHKAMAAMKKIEQRDFKDLEKFNAHDHTAEAKAPSNAPISMPHGKKPAGARSASMNRNAPLGARNADVDTFTKHLERTHKPRPQKHPQEHAQVTKSESFRYSSRGLHAANSKASSTAPAHEDHVEAHLRSLEAHPTGRSRPQKGHGGGTYSKPLPNMNVEHTPAGPGTFTKPLPKTSFKSTKGHSSRGAKFSPRVPRPINHEEEPPLLDTSTIEYKDVSDKAFEEMGHLKKATRGADSVEKTHKRIADMNKALKGIKNMKTMLDNKAEDQKVAQVDEVKEMLDQPESLTQMEARAVEAQQEPMEVSTPAPVAAAATDVLTEATALKKEFLEKQQAMMADFQNKLSALSQRKPQDRPLASMREPAETKETEAPAAAVLTSTKSTSVKLSPNADKDYLEAKQAAMEAKRAHVASLPKPKGEDLTGAATAGVSENLPPQAATHDVDEVEVDASGPLQMFKDSELEKQSSPTSAPQHSFDEQLDSMKVSTPTEPAM